MSKRLIITLNTDKSNLSPVTSNQIQKTRLNMRLIAILLIFEEFMRLMIKKLCDYGENCILL